MGDAMWDLACLSLDGAIDAERNAAMLCTYFGSHVSPSAYAWVNLDKAVADALRAFWGLLWQAHDQAGIMGRSSERALPADRTPTVR